MLNHLLKKLFLSCVDVNFFTSEELNPDICNQVKMLRVLEKARPKCAIEISSTFCGAHSVPKGSTAAQVCSHYIIDLKATSFTQATIDVIEKQLPAVLKLKKEGQY